VIGGKDRYRLHIGRPYTAFYVIDEKEKVVRVVEILSIEAAHKKYGF
jgi:mRNA-degrading endonuclease RelE of RelBE toxin-antitoxin system